MKVGGYTSKEFGHVVLSEWDDGMVIIMRRDDRGGVKGVYVTSLSPECLDEIAKLRAAPNPGELEVAV